MARRYPKPFGVIPPLVIEPWRDCKSCGLVIWNGDSVWVTKEKVTCFTCGQEDRELGIGYLDWAGLVLAGLDDLIG